ncbi:FecR family protein [Pendulispora brunnea]|uniref:FecR family protein n=1 Tax=Pendulispora brunnea TaxID=2905690 RepID=A0ABZ2KHL9_9BACT
MRRDRKTALDVILREAREDLVPKNRGIDGDFSAIDEKLFERIAREPVSISESRTGRERSAVRSPRLWGGVALVAAAAAAFVVFRSPTRTPIENTLVQGTQIGTQPTEVSPNAAPERARGESAASLRERQGTGEIRIAGTAVEPGHTLALSESVETADARAIFISGPESRPAVTWLLEERSRVEVQHAQLPLVLTLTKGAVEAQVAPVDHGEAFAVDIDGVRVAVHGTHLRVSREGGHVAVDLTEGVVAVGPIPSAGLTEGTVVNAPAHVEFETADISGSFRLDRTPTSIRTPVQLGGHRPDASRPQLRETLAREKTPDVRTASAPAAPMKPEEIIAKGVRACVASQLREATVRVTVSSKLSLKVAEDGSVYFARFNPPLAPEAQECASRIIYKTRFPHGGDVEIPLSSE